MATANKINSSGWVERRTSCSTTAAHSSLIPHSHPSRPRDRCAIRCRSLRYRWQILQASARRRGLEVSISFQLFCVLVKHVCANCGVSPLPGQFNGLDRVVSTLGYSPEDVVTSWGPCNMTRSTMSIRRLV
jgi:hypothetical protein